MTTPTAAPPAAILSAEARHRSRVRDRRIWVTRFLMGALVLAQGYASWGTHGLGVWAGLAWFEAWIPVVLIDTVVVVTAHAATAGMLPAKTDDREKLRRWAWGIALVGFTFGLVANVAHRHVTAPTGLPAGAVIVGDILAGAPTVLVLICLIFRGKIEDYAERLLRANDREEVAAEQAAAETARKEQLRRERQREKDERATPPAAAPAPVAAPPAPAAAAPAAAAETSDPDTEPHPITGDVATSKIAQYDQLLASRWAAGERPEGAELDRVIGGSYGRKAVRSWTEAVNLAAQDGGIEEAVLDAQLRDQFKWANGTARRAIRYVSHQNGMGARVFPAGLAAVPEPDTGETDLRDQSGNAA